MSAKFCVREEDVLELVVIGQWPRQASSELLAHVAGCAACADALVVSLAVASANEESLPAPTKNHCRRYPRRRLCGSALSCAPGTMRHVWHRAQSLPRRALPRSGPLV
jgi:hypothetical protein